LSTTALIKKIYTPLFVVIFVLALFPVQIIKSSDAQVKTNIENTELNIETAFKLIYSIKNIDEVFKEDLNTVIAYMMEAKNAYLLGDYARAKSKSEIAYEMSKGLIEEANGFYMKAQTEKSLSFRQQDIITGIVIILVLISGFISWRIIENRHFDNLLEKRPEAV
jgi:hypothetical protein